MGWKNLRMQKSFTGMQKNTKVKIWCYNKEQIHSLLFGVLYHVGLTNKYATTLNQSTDIYLYPAMNLSVTNVEKLWLDSQYENNMYISYSLYERYKLDIKQTDHSRVSKH